MGKENTMYYCEKCGEYFKEPHLRIEYIYHSELGSESPYYPERVATAVCPNCGNEDYIGAYECELCGEPFHEGYDLCPDCRRKIIEDIDDLAFDLGTGDHKENVEVIATWIAENL